MKLECESTNYFKQLLWRIKHSNSTYIFSCNPEDKKGFRKDDSMLKLFIVVALLLLAYFVFSLLNKKEK